MGGSLGRFRGVSRAWPTKSVPRCSRRWPTTFNPALSVGQAVALGCERLRAVSDSARTDALRLLEFELGRSGAWIVAHADEAVEAERMERYEASLERRAAGESLAYIVGSAGFYGRAFLVDERVLVPRPETEHVVMLALAFLRGRLWPSAPCICDVGTGSGILAVTLALEFPGANVRAIDVSEAAIAVARHNARALGAARIRFERGDLLAGVEPATRFDCIVANLPYIRSADVKAAPDPTSFEPRLALDGGIDGLEPYRRLLSGVQPRLAPGGTLLMEAGPDSATALAELTRAALGDSAEIGVHVDYGARERVVAARVRG